MRSVLFVFLILFYDQVASRVPPAILKDQTYNFPQSPVPTTPGILPHFNVPLAAGATNIADLTFGTSVEGATVQSVNELGNVAYFYDLFGDPSDTRSAPVDGIPRNFLGIYSFYNEFLPNSTERNPLAVHQVLEDRLRLVARTSMNGSEPGARYEIGYIRLPVQLLPGMLAELTLAPGGWPTCRWSWPTFWAFSGVMLQGPPGNVTRYYGSDPLEIDGFDGFPRDNTTQAIRIPNGAIIYGPAADYDYPEDLFLKTTGDFRYENEEGVTWMDTTPSTIPTDPSNPGMSVCIDWTDRSTLKWLYNGEVVRIQHVFYPANYSNKTDAWDGAPPPQDLIGEALPLFIMISHQFGVESNPIDGKALEQYNGSIFASYDIQSIRVWNAPSTLLPPSATQPSPLPPPRTGPSLGDLPEITTGTYVLNVEAVDGSVIDHFGATVTLLGNAVLANDTINGLPATRTTYIGGISTDMGGISVQETPALYWAQPTASGNGNFWLFQVSYDTQMSNWWNAATLAQFINLYPPSDFGFNKTTLMMNSYRGLQALFENSQGNTTSSTANFAISPGQTILATLQQTIKNGIVSLSVGKGNKTEVSVGTVPASAFSGFNELLIGSGRNKYGLMQAGADFLHGQTLMVATPANSTLSLKDLAAIEIYFMKKWGIELDSHKHIKINFN